MIDVNKYYEELKLEEAYLKDKKAKETYKYLASHQEVRLFHASKQRAKKANMEHTISISDIVIPEYCPYLGCKITNIYRQGRVWSNASIDRIDPYKGYIPGNIRVVSDLANKMKQNATEPQLIAFAKGVLKLHGGAESN